MGEVPERRVRDLGLGQTNQMRICVASEAAEDGNDARASSRFENHPRCSGGDLA